MPMSLLKRIQDGTLDKDCDVANLLRLCKVFAAQAAAPELAEWVGHELNGYPDAIDLPDYRKLRVSSKGHFSGPYGSGLQNAEIPIQTLPEKFRDKYRHAYIAQSVGSLQATLEGQSEGALSLPWPTEAVQLFGGDMYENMHCMQAWKVLSTGSLRGILDAVKTRVLDFTLALGRLHPDLMTAGSSDANIASPQELRQTFNTTIYGSVGAIANASTNVAQHVTVSPGDRAALDRQLASQGVPPEDIADLHRAMKADAEKGEGSSLGPKVKEWLGNAVLKVGSGLWSTTIETAGKVLPPLIAGYLGIELKQ
jgi:hypothetical protein